MWAPIIKTVKLPTDGTCHSAGGGDCELIAPNGSTIVKIPYVSEPPHGDSYHSLMVNDRKVPGYAWGGAFAFTPDSRYFVCSWMAEWIDRKTLVADCVEQKYFVLPEYISRFSLQWPKVVGVAPSEDLCYEFTGSEEWLSY